MGLYDLIIIGGGILGLAVAHRLKEVCPEKTVALLEKEEGLARHQSGRNSGVVHSGIYYKPGSLKARHCREGKQLLEEFCAREGIDLKICGKVIVATQEGELAALEAIYQRGQANGVRCEMISPGRLRELEPYTAGLQAVWVPEAGIVDFRRVCERLAARLEEQGGRIVLRAQATGLVETSREVRVATTQGDWGASLVINCAGLHSDRVGALGGAAPLPVKIVPFRGEYHQLTPEARKFCNALIYPVPDPRFPFLGVHLSRTIAGEVKCGPNAVLAWAREGYRGRDINLADVWETLTYPGFLRLAGRYWRPGLLEEWRSLSRKALVRALGRLVPEITGDHLLPAPSGVRAQAVARDGTLLDDFAFRQTPRVLHVLNAPSPGATASLSLARALVDKLSLKF